MIETCSGNNPHMVRDVSIEWTNNETPLKTTMKIIEKTNEYPINIVTIHGTAMNINDKQ